VAHDTDYVAGHFFGTSPFITADESRNLAWPERLASKAA
jgi:hypothetical protein